MSWAVSSKIASEYSEGNSFWNPPRTNEKRVDKFFCVFSTGSVMSLFMFQLLTHYPPVQTCHKEQTARCQAQFVQMLHLLQVLPVGRNMVWKVNYLRRLHDVWDRSLSQASRLQLCNFHVLFILLFEILLSTLFLYLMKMQISYRAAHSSDNANRTSVCVLAVVPMDGFCCPLVVEHWQY